MIDEYEMYEQLTMLDEIDKAIAEELAENEEGTTGQGEAITKVKATTAKATSATSDGGKQKATATTAKILKAKEAKASTAKTTTDSAKEKDKAEDEEQKKLAQLMQQGGGRKPFRIPDFDPPRDREMAVFTHAKKLSEYIFVITEKSPVKFRWNILSRLLNTSTDIIECLYHANYNRGAERIVWQKKAMVALCLLDFYAETAKTKQAITFRQMAIIGKQITDVKKLLSGWVKSTKKKDKQEGYL